MNILISFLAVIFLFASPVFAAEKNVKAPAPTPPAPQVTAPQAVAPKVPTVKNVLEKNHLPVISIPKTVAEGEMFNVAIQVGSELLATKKDHRIEWIKVYLDNQEIVSLKLSEAIPEPRTTFPLKVTQPAVLKVEAHCNQHGTWGSEVRVATTTKGVEP